MASDNKWNNEEIWEEIANAPLSPDQLTELVAACDDRPELWKRCALALLEEQILRHELQQMARDQLSYAPQQHRAAPVSAPLPSPAPLAATGRMHNPDQSTANGRTLFWNNLALAASLLIVFGIGWQASHRFGAAAPSNIQVPSATASQLTQSLTTPDGMGTAIGQPGQEANGQSGSSYVVLDPAMIDQVNAETLATAMQSDWKEELDPDYQQLRQAGYDVESQNGLMPFWLRDGSSAVIPYQQFIVRPKSKSRNY